MGRTTLYVVSCPADILSHSVNFKMRTEPSEKKLMCNPYVIIRVGNIVKFFSFDVSQAIKFVLVKRIPYVFALLSCRQPLSLLDDQIHRPFRHVWRIAVFPQDPLHHAPQMCPRLFPDGPVDAGVLAHGVGHLFGDGF